jgi:hypothetical protein
LNTGAAKLLAQEIDWSFLLRLSIYQQSRLGPRGIVPLGQGWHSTLLELNLVACRLGHFGMQTLAPLLPTSLQTLNLSDNAIGKEGAWKLASMLPPQLKQFDLSRNTIGDEGCSEIVHHLPNNIRNLILSHNQIGDAGAKTLATAITANDRALQEVWLDHNQIQDDGATALMEALDQCPSIKVLELTDNPISSSRMHVLNVILRHRTTKSATRRVSTSSHVEMQNDSKSSLSFSEHHPSTLPTATIQTILKSTNQQCNASWNRLIELATMMIRRYNCKG